MNEIEGKNPNLVRMLAAQGLSAEDIAGMTRMELDYVREVLAQPVPEQGKTGPVNTTPKGK